MLLLFPRHFLYAFLFPFSCSSFFSFGSPFASCLEAGVGKEAFGRVVLGEESVGFMGGCVGRCHYSTFLTATVHRIVSMASLAQLRVSPGML